MSTRGVTLLALLLATGISLAQETGRIEGTVVDEATGKGIAGASIMAYPEGERGRLVAAESDERGSFVLQGLQNTAYDLRVTAAGYAEELQRGVVVTTGKTKSLTIRLRAKGSLVARTFDLRYKNPVELASLIKPFLSGNGEVIPGQTMRVLTVRDTPEVLDKVAGLLARYDVQPKQVRLDLHLFLADGSGERKRKIPADLAPVVRKLSALFRYSHYSLLGSGTAIVYSGELCQLQVGISERIFASCSVERVEYLEADGGAVRLEKLRLSAPTPGVVLGTSLNLPLGEFVVVGRASSKGPEEAVVAVMKAELVK
ncbi:MAG: carboxypeptidase regulatory-like domain-containing protein [Calditrichaeota bacterium]|nr:carboxypeptidase regulatory-like domain-containing protein [Calditrichota bacterium]